MEPCQTAKQNKENKRWPLKSKRAFHIPLLWQWRKSFRKLKKIVFECGLINYQIWKKNLYLSIFLLCYAATLILAEEVI